MFRSTLLILLFLATLTGQPSWASSGGQPTAQDDKTLTFAADLWCPVNCEAGTNRPGFAVDLLKQIYEPLGYKINYITMPWARAVERAEAGEIDGVVGALKEDAQNLIFPAEPLLSITDDFYVLSDSQQPYTGLESLKGVAIGIISDYSYSTPVTALLVENARVSGAVQAVSGEDALNQNIRKLRAGRISVICESSIIMDHTLNQLDLTKEIKWLGGDIPSGDIYVAFSPARAGVAALSQAYDQGVTRLRQNGEIIRIYDSYGVRP